MATLQQAVRRAFGENALNWWSWTYLIDWLVATSFWVFSYLISLLPVFEREFRRSDLTIGYHHHKSTIKGTTNNAIAIFAPLSLFVAGSVSSRSLIELHHSVLGLWLSRSLTHLITEFLKNRVGRLRPDFLERCKWDKEAKSCTGKLDDILDGRQSFPSGHSSAIFSCMMFLSLWIAGKTGAWCLRTDINPRRLFMRRIFLSRPLSLTLTLIPISFASWVAISRLEDYRHHKEDVIVGSLLGTIIATVSYLTYYPSPFSAQNFQDGIANQPKTLYTSDNSNSRSGDNNIYQLSRMEEDIENV